MAKADKKQIEVNAAFYAAQNWRRERQKQKFFVVFYKFKMQAAGQQQGNRLVYCKAVLREQKGKGEQGC